jgi:hypothetical protein
MDFTKKYRSLTNFLGKRKMAFISKVKLEMKTLEVEDALWCQKCNRKSHIIENPSLRAK